MKKIIIAIVAILLSAMALGVFASSFSIGDFSSDKNNSEATTNDPVEVADYDPVIYMLSARSSNSVTDPVLELGGGGQEWTPVVAPVECRGYSFDIGEYDYFDFEKTATNKYVLDLAEFCGEDLRLGQFYSIVVKSYNSNEIGTEISFGDGSVLLGNQKAVYNDSKTGKRCVCVTYFVYAISELKMTVDNPECEVLCYLTPFELFETGYIAVMVAGESMSAGSGEHSEAYTVFESSAGKYFSCNYTGDTLSATVDGDSSVVSEFEYWTGSPDMFMFETYVDGVLEINHPGTVFSIFNTISEPLTLPEGFVGEKVLEYTLTNGDSCANAILEYVVPSGEYVFVLSELYDSLGLIASVDGEAVLTKDCAAGSHLISIPESEEEHTIKFTFTSKGSFAKGRFVLFKVNG